MAPFLLFVAFSFSAQRQISVLKDASYLSLFMLCAYIAHQVEEHWIDATGKTYAFHGYVNDLLGGLVRAPENAEILTKTAIFVVNTSLVWLVGAIAIVFSRFHTFPVLCLAAIVLVNAVSHSSAAILSGAYNPGLVTALFPFFPLSLWVFWLFRRSGAGVIAGSIVWAVFAHAVLMGGAIAANWAGMVPEFAYFAILVGASIIPALVFISRPAQLS
ncbi:MAG: HXXEE domain-containing protein [Pseudomonadota bacterium]